jgi:hypothetical protein
MGEFVENIVIEKSAGGTFSVRGRQSITTPTSTVYLGYNSVKKQDEYRTYKNYDVIKGYGKVSLPSSANIEVDFQSDCHSYTETIDPINADYSNADDVIGKYRTKATVTVGGGTYDVIVAENNDYLRWHYFSQTFPDNIDGDLTFSVSTKVHAAVYRKYITSEVQTDFNKEYGDGEPYLCTPVTAQYYFIITSVDVSCTWDGGGSYTATYEGDPNTEVYEIGESSIDVTATHMQGLNTYEDSIVAGKVQVCNVSFTGDSNDILVSSQSSVEADYVCDGGLVYNSIGCGEHSGGSTEIHLHLTKGGYTVNYNGTIEHCDGTPVQGMQLVAGERGTVESNTFASGADGKFAFKKIYRGSGYIWGNPIPTAQVDADDLGILAFDENNNHIPAAYHDIDDMPNLQDMDEFHFFNDGNFNSDSNMYRVMSDRRVLLDLGDRTCDGVCTLNIATSKLRHVLPAAGWSVISGAATVTTDASGNLKVVVGASDAAISRTYESNTTANLSGARYVNLDFDNPGSDPVNIDINGKVSKSLTAGATTSKTSDTIDMVKDFDTTEQTDTSQTYMYGSNSSFGWGITRITSISLSNLKAGKTYVFRGFYQILVGTPKLYLYDGGFVGTEPGDSDYPDNYAITGLKNADGTDPANYPVNSRCAVIICDNWVIAEFFNVQHTKSGSFYYHRPFQVDIDSNSVIYPRDSVVTYTGNPNANLGWSDYTNFPLFNLSGLVPVETEGTTISLNYAARVNQVIVPLDYTGGHTVNITKRFRGKCCVFVYDTSGNPAANVDVTVNLYDDDITGSTPISTQTLQTDSTGKLWMDTVQQASVLMYVISGVDNTGAYTKLTLTGLTNEHDYSGHTILVSNPQSNFNPTSCQISSQANSVVTLSVSLIPENCPVVGQKVWICRPYQYGFEVAGENSTTIKARLGMRNRNLTFATIRGVVIQAVRGLLYRKSDGALICNCRGSTDGHLRCGNLS